MYKLAISMLLFAAVLSAQNFTGGASWQKLTVAQLQTITAATANKGWHFTVTDGANALDCVTTGGGTDVHDCASTGAAWVAIGTGAGMSIGGTVSSGTTNSVLFVGSGPVLSQISAVNNSVLSTNGSGVPSESTTLPTNLAMQTPASINLTHATALPISTGVSGLGTGVATALGVNVGSAGSPVVSGGALGTPSSGTLTNVTGLPVAGITGLGAGVGTALGLAASGTGAICLASGSSCGGGSVTWQAAGSTVVSGATANFATGSLVTDVGGVATVNPDTGYLLTNGNDQANHCKFVDSTNGTTSYTASLATGCTALTSGNLVAGSLFMLRANATCSSSCTLAIDGVPNVAASIKKADGTTDPGGAIVSGRFYWIVFDGTLFRLF